MKKLWTTGEVARYLGVNEIDVEELVKEGKLTGYKLGGQFLRFRPDQVEAVRDTLHFRPSVGRPTSPASMTVWTSTRDFFYFYDFYLLSATFLAVLVIYLVAAG